MGHYPRLSHPLCRSLERGIHHAAIPSQVARRESYELGADQVDP